MLLIDAGNSRIKSSLLRDGEFVPLEPVDTSSIDPPAAWRSLQAPNRVIASSVAGSLTDAKIRAWSTDLWGLEPSFARVRANAGGMTTRYDHPEQLGVDRWLAALGGYHLVGGAVCVVDAGTALTVDVVDAAGMHLGGSISPGVSLMIKSLTHNTARLRLDKLEPAGGIATNTAAAISTGCIDAVAGGIERMKQRVTTELNCEPRWLITGGEAQILMQTCAIDFEPVPDLVLRGLLLAEGPQS